MLLKKVPEEHSKVSKVVFTSVSVTSKKQVAANAAKILEIVPTNAAGMPKVVPEENSTENSNGSSVEVLQEVLKKTHSFNL